MGISEFHFGSVKKWTEGALWEKKRSLIPASKVVCVGYAAHHVVPIFSWATTIPIVTRDESQDASGAISTRNEKIKDFPWWVASQ